MKFLQISATEQTQDGSAHFVASIENTHTTGYNIYLVAQRE